MWRPTLARWQSTQARAHAVTSLFTFHQTYLAVTIVFETREPGWARSWTTLKTAWRRPAGTYGRNTPIDLSTRREAPESNWIVSQVNTVIAVLAALVSSWSAAWAVARASHVTAAGDWTADTGLRKRASAGPLSLP